jgi:hypothetical protein
MPRDGFAFTVIVGRYIDAISRIFLYDLLHRLDMFDLFRNEFIDRFFTGFWKLLEFSDMAFR